jgi:hypothetical protein
MSDVSCTTAVAAIIIIIIIISSSSSSNSSNGDGSSSSSSSFRHQIYVFKPKLMAIRLEGHEACMREACNAWKKINRKS